MDHFDLTNSQQGKEVLHLYFEERNIPPQEHASRLLISKGFHKEVTIQDFPLRGNTAYPHVKRRRWIVAQGTRLSKVFAAFLKEGNR